MTDINKFRKEYERRYARKFCHVNGISECPNKEKCTCKIAAEIKSHLKTIIASPYYNYTIDDFTGKYKGKELLSRSIAIKAKEQLVKYCWGDDMELVDFNSLNEKQRDEKSVIDLRRKQGQHIVVSAGTSDFSIGLKNKSGKTFIAALVMREAIKRKGFPGHQSVTYAWTQFPMLEYRIKHDDPSLTYAMSADWLVVDDIMSSAQTRAAEAYISSIINPFFFERMQSGLPTILVFRFDISQMADLALEEKFGVAISKMLKDSRTTKIFLSEQNGDK
jgi:DNA replication protein DnaC